MIVLRVDLKALEIARETGGKRILESHTTRFSIFHASGSFCRCFTVCNATATRAHAMQKRVMQTSDWKKFGCITQPAPGMVLSQKCDLTNRMVWIVEWSERIIGFKSRHQGDSPQQINRDEAEKRQEAVIIRWHVLPASFFVVLNDQHQRLPIVRVRRVRRRVRGGGGYGDTSRHIQREHKDIPALSPRGP
jgi:hypothetical protein